MMILIVIWLVFSAFYLVSVYDFSYKDVLGRPLGFGMAVAIMTLMNCALIVVVAYLSFARRELVFSGAVIVAGIVGPLAAKRLALQREGNRVS